MSSLNRRTFTQLAGASALAAVVGTGISTNALAADDIKLRWWDHYAPLEPLLQAQFDAYKTEHPTVTVEHELYNLPDLGQALQLAFNSKQAPDVHAIASLQIPTSRLVEDGWFTPIQEYVSEEFLARFPKGALLEGLHIFDGKLYSFPMFSSRSSSSLLWFNKSLVEKAGLDPEAGPKTWDEFRAAAKAITDQGSGRSFGWIQAIQLAERLGVQVTELAETAGAAGPVDWKTGEYAYHTEPFIQAMEFLLSLQTDGSLFPASTSLDARTARARFSTGVAGFNFDGPWTIGVINNDYKEFADQVGVAQTPVPDVAKPGYITRGPNGGDFWVSSQSKHPEDGAGILENFNLPEFYVKLAERMDQPPLDLTAVDKADVHPAYKAALGYFSENVRLAPVPEIKNPAVSEVLAKMTDIRPNFGELVQGVFSGDVSDYKTAFKGYSDKLTAERDKAIKAVQGTGAKVSTDDWVFANWEAGTDYTSELYKK